MTKYISTTNRQTIQYFIYILIGLFILPYGIKQLLKSPHSGQKEEVVISRPPLTEVADNTDINEPQSITPDWTVIKAKKGDSLTTLFEQAELSQSLLRQWLSESKYQARIKSIHPGQALSLIKDSNGKFKELKLSLSEIEYLHVSYDNDSFHEEIVTEDLNKNRFTKSFVIQNSLLEAAANAKLPKEIIYKLLAIFKQKVDFSRDIRAGDRVSVIYDSESLGDKTIKYGPIIAATIQLKNQRVDAIYHIHGQRGDYYQSNGQSLELGFDRYPVKFSHIGSVFNLHRYHPILHITRAHRGIDLAAPLGTPIKAVANGIVTHIGPLGGFGNMVKLKHSGKYETIYAHMLRFKRGLKKGSKVLRGAVIGYVGETGLATAPHCHFEFHVKGTAVNPATVKLPIAGRISKEEAPLFNERSKQLLSLLEQ